MEATEIYDEACRVMDRVNEVGASVDDTLLILAVVMAHLLHHNAPDAFGAGAAIAQFNTHTIDCYGRLKRGALH